MTKFLGILYLVVLISDIPVEARRIIYGHRRPLPYQVQNNFQRPQIIYGNNGWGSYGLGNSGWGHNGFGANKWGNHGFGTTNLGTNVFGASNLGNNGFGNIGWGFNNFGVRPGQVSEIPNGQVIDIHIPPPKPNQVPKEEAKPDPKPAVYPVYKPSQTTNPHSTDETQGEEVAEAVVDIPTDENSENQEPAAEDTNQNNNEGDIPEAENTATEETSTEQNPGVSENNDKVDENTAAEESSANEENNLENTGNENSQQNLGPQTDPGVNDENSAGTNVSTTNGNEQSSNTEEDEPLPDLTDIFDVRLNLNIGTKNKTESGEINSNAINRRGDNICGIPGITTELGAVDKATLLPWLVTIGKRENSIFTFLCGGTLISPDVVLTSAHCFHQESPTAAKIGDEFIEISKVMKHEKYNTSQAYNNIALVKLFRPMNTTVTACIPPDMNSSLDKTGLYASALEWKQKYNEEFPRPGIMVTKVFPNAQCVKDYENVDYGNYFPKGFDSTLLCVKLQMPFVCQGDSGIQLFSVDETNDIYTLIGTVANPEASCGGIDYPGIYTKISYFLPWIEEASRKLRL